jgi:hypothetical protein
MKDRSEDDDKMAPVSSPTSNESTTSPKKRDVETGNLVKKIISPVHGRLIPKIQKAPWHHFIILTLCVALP